MPNTQDTGADTQAYKDTLAQLESLENRYRKLENEYQYFKDIHRDPATGQSAMARLNQIYGYKWFQWMNKLHTALDKKRGISVPPPSQETRPAALSREGLPRIAMVIDAHGWAFDNVATQIIKYLSDYYSFTKIFVCDADFDNPAKTIFALQGFDLVHIFWRGYFWTMESDFCASYIRQLGGNYEAFMEQYYRPLRFSTCIPDHLLLKENDMPQVSAALKTACSYYTISQKLFGIYSQNENFPKPSAVIQDGINLNLFVPQNLDRLKDVPHRKLKVGWSGNSVWNESGSSQDLKGIHTILIPAVENLQKQGYAVELELADRQKGIIPFEEMPNFYSKIDVYVCASLYEGTPNPVLEAMACGVAVISTDVGVVPEVFGQLQKEFIMKDRSQQSLENMLKRILESPEILLQLSQENLESIRPWDWSYRAKLFKEFFDACLSK